MLPGWQGVSRSSAPLWARILPVACRRGKRGSTRLSLSYRDGRGTSPRKLISVRTDRLVVRERLGVDEDEKHAGHAIAAVVPGMVGAPLDEYIAGSHQGLVLVEHGPDLALEADRV